MATCISQLAVIDPQADIDDEVEIGPFCVVGPKVRIGRGTRLENNVTILSRVTLGQFNHVYPGAVLGGDPQDVSYRLFDLMKLNKILDDIAICLG